MFNFACYWKQLLAFLFLLVALGVSPKGAEASSNYPEWLYKGMVKESNAAGFYNVPDTWIGEFELLGAVRERNAGRKVRAIGIATGGLGTVATIYGVYSLTRPRPSCGRYNYACMFSGFGESFVIAGTALSGVAAVVGAVMIFVGNRRVIRAKDYLRQINVDSNVKRATIRIAVSPVISPRQQGVALAMSF